RSIAVQYHLHRLRHEPGYLLEIVDRPEGSPAGEAVRIALERGTVPDRWLFPVYLDLLGRGKNDFGVSLRTQYDEVFFEVLSPTPWDGFALWEEPGWAAKGGSAGGTLDLTDPLFSRLKAIEKLLLSLHFSLSEVAEFPGAEFSFFPNHREDLPAGS